MSERSSFTFSFDDEIKAIRVESDSPSIFASLIDVFTVGNPSYFYLEKNGIKFADETFSAITPLGTFQIGMFPVVYVAALKIVGNDKSRIHISDEDKERIRKECFPLKGRFDDTYEVEEINPKFPYRWFQKDGVEALMRHGRGICISPTASGKSLMIAALVNEIRKAGFPEMGDRKHILLIVPTRQLVDQMAGDFDEYGIGDYSTYTSNSGSKRAGTFKDNSCKDGFNNLIITNHTWITEKYKDKKFPLKKIGCIIADEVHTIKKGTQILKLVKRIDATLKFGLTATQSKFVFDRWINYGEFGITVFQTNIKQLQNEGFLTKLEIRNIHGLVKNLDPHLPFSLSRSRARLNDVLPDGTLVDVGTAYKMELEFLENNCERLWMPVFEKIGDSFDFSKNNMVVLFDRISIGKTLQKSLSERMDGINVHYIDGTVDIAVREDIRSRLEKSVGNILLAQTVTASVGLNIKNLHGIVFAFSGRSYIRTIQSIGRVLRQNKNKTVAKLYEVWYNLKYSSKHHDEKMEILIDSYGDDCIKDTINLEI